MRRAWDAEAPLRGAELVAEGDLAYRALAAYLCDAVFQLAEGLPARILDAGCGLGFLAARLAAEGHAVTGADLSGASLALARSLHGRGALRFERCDIGCPQRRWGEGYDVVIANMVLHNTPDAAGFLVGCQRALRPGGALLLTVTEPRSYLEKQGVAHRYSSPRRFDFPLHPRRARAAHLPVPYWHRPIDAYLRSLDQAGFAFVWHELPPRLGGARRRDVLVISATKPPTPEVGEGWLLASENFFP